MDKEQIERVIAECVAAEVQRQFRARGEEDEVIRVPAPSPAWMEYQALKKREEEEAKKKTGEEKERKGNEQRSRVNIIFFLISVVKSLTMRSCDESICCHFVHAQLSI